MKKYEKGSEWRRWDLQVQTILDDGYIELKKYAHTLKASHPREWDRFISLVGSEEDAIKFDSKEYFYTDSSVDDKTRAKNYSSTFVYFLECFHQDEICIAITDHNYDHPYLLDELINASKQSISVNIIAGVEINVQGVHMLALFGDLIYKKKSFSDGIKTFLTKIEIDNKKTDGRLTVSNKSYTDVIDIVKENKGIVIYPHCNSDNGLFQERGKTDRTHLAAQFNYQEFNILQGKDKSCGDKLLAYIVGKSQDLKSECCYITATDARCLNNILRHDAQGNYTWIKGDPNFSGLLHACCEADSRFYIGKLPKILEKVRSNKTKYITSLCIDCQKNKFDDNQKWFKSIEIKFNNELVAIIGNKGSGKSAIADIIGLCGDSENYKDFSFLNKFKKGGLSSRFFANLNFESGFSTESLNLDSSVQQTNKQKVRYLPQTYFEKVCNEIQSVDAFRDELEKVVFQYIPEENKLKKNSFRELIAYNQEAIKKEIQLLAYKINDINDEIIVLEDKKNPNYKNSLESQKAIKEAELKSHLDNQPKPVENPQLKQENPDVIERQKTLEEWQKKNDQLTAEHIKNIHNVSENEHYVKDLIKLKREIHAKTIEFNEFISSKKPEAERLDLEINDIVNIKYNFTDIDNKIKIKNDIIANIKKELDVSDNLEVEYVKLTVKSKLDFCLSKISEIKNQLTAEQLEYQEYIENLKKWTDIKTALEGNNDATDGIAFLQKEIDYIGTDLQTAIDLKRRERVIISNEIYAKKMEIKSFYDEVKSEIDKQLKISDINEYNYEIKSLFSCDKEFVDEILKYIHQGKVGTFFGKEEGAALLKSKVNMVDWNNKESVGGFLQEIIQSLEHDERCGLDGKRTYIDELVKNRSGFYSYLFSLNYLKPHYELQQNGKALEQLSPGEKGALLLIFYLVLDKEDIPLIIDQPEDNLDNHSVATVLVPYIKEAKNRRQIIMVTHNPNLAVVADAEQVIRVKIDKENSNVFSFESGGIENQNINSAIVDILEGTMPAFSTRKSKYK